MPIQAAIYEGESEAPLFEFDHLLDVPDVGTFLRLRIDGQIGKFRVIEVEHVLEKGGPGIGAPAHWVEITVRRE